MGIKLAEILRGKPVVAGEWSSLRLGHFSTWRAWAMKGIVRFAGVVLLAVAGMAGATTISRMAPGEWSCVESQGVEGGGWRGAVQDVEYVVWLSSRDMFDSTFSFTGMPGAFVVAALRDDMVFSAAGSSRGKTHFAGDDPPVYPFDFAAGSGAALGARANASDRTKAGQAGLYARITQDFVPIVPEPTGALLCGIGMCGLLVRRHLRCN